jgi:tetratricopeptide (TPR) repeat protein
MHIVEKQQRFSQSLIWQLQRDYFNAAGINAWRSGEVPHYITSNPVMGKTYAELVLAFLRDLALRGQAKEPVYLLELGAGHGRLCYHFFKHFETYYEQSAIPLPPFCYVLSDFTAANLAFWKDHPRLQPYLAKGWLDFALFDVEDSSELALQHTGNTIQIQALAQPLILIANYFFDSISQDLFRIENKTIFHSLLSLSTEADPAELDAASLIAALNLQYDYEEAKSPIYAGEPLLDTLLETYRQQLTNSHVLFPHTGIRCLERIRQLSRQGLVLLSADKGRHHLSDLDGIAAPRLATHGSFSLNVNYHALGQYCIGQGGLALFPRHPQENLDLGCLLFLADAPAYRETTSAYERFVSDYGPDEFFTLKKIIEQHPDTLTHGDIMVVIRLSGYDARMFKQMLPRLHETLPTISINERWTLYQTIIRIWDTYYPLGEPHDLAFDLACLLMLLEFFPEAIVYFELSLDIYGQEANTLFNIALCHHLLGNADQTQQYLRAVLRDDPTHEAALSLIAP